MKKLSIRLLAGACAAIQPCGPSAALTVSGLVTDAGGNPVAGALVSFANEARPSQLSADLTGIEGTYRVVLETATVVEQESLSPLPAGFHLFQNYPNPFNPSTLIPYQLGAAAQVRLRVYNLLGQPIRTLVDEVQPAGLQVVEWDGRSDSGTGMGAGVYLVRMEAEGFAQSRKVVLVDGAGGKAPVSPGHASPKPIALQPAGQDLYTVRITGEALAPFSRSGIAIRADTTFDFQVGRLPAGVIAVATGGDIAAAMKRAGRGGVVVLAEGTYAGQRVDLKEGVVLRGKDPSRTVLSDCLLRAWHLSGAAIEHLAVRNSGSDTVPAISISASEVALRDCHLEGNQAFCAVQVEGEGAQAIIQGCSISDNPGIGVWVKAGAQGRLSQNTIAGNGGETAEGALRLSGAGTAVVMRDNVIRDNRTLGLIVEQGAGGQIAGNAFAGNAKGTAFPQIEIRDPGTAPVVQGNTVRGRGIGIRGGAAGQLSGNTIEATETGIAIELEGNRTNPVIQDNTLRGSVRIDEQAEGQVLGNAIDGRQNGIEISGAGTSPSIRDNTLRGEAPGTVGIKIGEGTAGQIYGNTIAGYAVGIQILGTPGLGLDLRDNLLRNNGRDMDLSNPDLLWRNRFAQGQRDLRAGRFARAAEAFRLAAAEASDPFYQVEGRYYLGVALVRMGRFEEAVPVFKAVLDLAPQHLKARWNLRIAWRQTGKDPEALEARYRLTLAPGIPPAHEPMRFTDVGPQAGVALVNMGRASAWRDLDDDGWLDLFTVADGGPQALFRNQGDGTFAQLTEAAGLSEWRGGWSALWIDYDNDGEGDLFVTRDAFNGWGMNTLYHNEGNGKFADVTQRAGLKVIDDAFGAAWGDYDNDGWPDLYVAYGIAQKGCANALYHNNQDGTFTDVAVPAGVDNGRQATIGVAWGDYDNDGWLDLYVVNSGTANALYHNNGDGTFAEVTAAAGVAAPRWGFVAFFFDFDNDGWLDLFVSNFAQTMEEVIQSAISGEASLFPDNRAFLYHNNQDGTFTDVAVPAGLGRTWGTMSAAHGDLDNDGYQDLYLANGGPAMDRFEPDRLFLNNGDGTFAEVTEAAGLSLLGKGHGTAMADFDNDGDLDIYSPQGGASANPGDAQPNRLYRNEGNSNHWLMVQLSGRAGSGASPFSNRDGVGARVRVEVKGAIRYAEVSGGCGFGVTNSLPVEFGLGRAARVEAVEIRWPSGLVDRVKEVPADRTLTIVEGMAEKSSD